MAPEAAPETNERPGLQLSVLTGTPNLGAGNVGDFNTGINNDGNFNTGVANGGDFNIGGRNTGDFNIGSNNTGNFNIGVNNDGDYNVGLSNSGVRNFGVGNTGTLNVGIGNTGVGNIGFFNSTDYTIGAFNIGLRYAKAADEDTIGSAPSAANRRITTTDGNKVEPNTTRRVSADASDAKRGDQASQRERTTPESDGTDTDGDSE